MPNQGLLALARLAHRPTRNFKLGTESGLCIDVVQGIFEVRVFGLEEEGFEEGAEAIEAPVRKRMYKMGCAVGFDDDRETSWLIKTTHSTRSHSDRIDMNIRYPRFSKEWTEALVEWMKASKEYRRRDTPWLNKSNEPKTSYYQQNSCIFRGALLACWLAVQDDVLSVVTACGTTRSGPLLTRTLEMNCRGF